MSTHTLIVSPERELEPGARLQAKFTIDSHHAEGTAVSLRVAFASASVSPGSTVARWIVKPNDEIDFVVALSGNERSDAEAKSLPVIVPFPEPQRLPRAEGIHFPGLLRHLFLLRELLPEDVFSKKIHGQLDRLLIKLRLPNYLISERDLETPSAFWLERARQLPPETAYKRLLVATFHELSHLETAEFLHALQFTEKPELNAALDKLLEPA